MVWGLVPEPSGVSGPVPSVTQGNALSSEQCNAASEAHAHPCRHPPEQEAFRVETA